jgi:hypothetical protein
MPIAAPIEVSAACVEVSAHIAEVLIADVKEPSQRAALEQDRTKIIRRSAEGCTRDAWSDASQKCFANAKTAAAIQVCASRLKAPAASPGSPAASGS